MPFPSLSSWGLLAGVTLAASPLTFEHVITRALPTPAGAETRAFVAQHRSALGALTLGFREDPELVVEAGTRRQSAGRSDTSADVAMSVELPLLRSPALRQALAGTLDHAEPALVRAAAVLAELALREVYLDTWFAQELTTLRANDLATVETWCQVIRQRHLAGAESELSVTQVEAEWLRAREEWDEQRSAWHSAWFQLRTLADLPAEPVLLAPLPERTLGEPEDLRRQHTVGALRAGLQVQEELSARAAQLAEAVAESRWAAVGSAAREGDESVFRLGLAYRLPRRDEVSTRRAAQQAERDAVAAANQRATAELAARLDAATARWNSAASPGVRINVPRALAALDLRLTEGREGPAVILPQRRPLIEAQIAEIRRITRGQRSLGEILALTAPAAEALERSQP